TAKARDGAGGIAGLDQLAGDADGQLLAGLALPDDEAAAGVLAGPAGVALAVLHDRVPADGARAEAGAGDADVLELCVEVPDGLAGEAGDVVHEAFARVLPLLDLAQAMLPVAGHFGGRQGMPVEQA